MPVTRPALSQPEQTTLLLVDIVDSAALAERLGDAAMASLWAAHDRAARDLLRLWRGREIDKTDGFLLIFGLASDGLGFALAYHRALAALPTPISARAGLHVGPVTVRENPAQDIALGAKPLEVDGLAKPVAARVMSAALGGQTLLTEAARQALGPVAQRLLSHGHWRLKGLPEPMELFEAGELGAPFTPPPDSAKAYRVVQRDGAWQPVREIRHSLPAERDSFVGRHAAMLDLARRYAQGARLVSVLGIGGTGKTRLVKHFGWTWLGDHPGGVWFCDLAPARGLDGLVHAVAQGLEVPLGKADPVEQLGHAIAGRGHCLVILDNFEQVARHAEDTLGRWLDRAPEAQFLVTTREVLGIAGEEALALAPLPWTEAESLFALRASAAHQHFQPGDDDRAAIAALVRLLDGLPLAIELAAARARVLPPRALLARMSERFKLLSGSGGRRDRQSTLRATFDWSWDLLAPAERAALAQLSVFESGFTLAAAEAVLDLQAFDDAPWGVDAVNSLIDKSFVRALDGGRLDLLVSVQVYADEHLRTEGRFAGSGAAALQVAQARHGAWYAALGPAHAAHGDSADLDNLVVACQRAAARGDGPVAVGALEGAWAALSLHGPFKPGVGLAQQVVAMTGLSPAQAARVHLVLNRTCDATGRLAEARMHAEHALALAEPLQDRRCLAEARIQLALLLARDGNGEAARAMLTEALRLAREIADPQLAHSALNNLGNVDYELGRVAEAVSHYEAALDIATAHDHPIARGSVLGNLGIVYMALDRVNEAQQSFEEALAVARGLGDRKREGNTLCNLGLLHHMQGNAIAGAEVSDSALLIAREIGFVRLECTVLCNLGIFHTALDQVALAAQYLVTALGLSRRLLDQRLEGLVLGYLGALHTRRRDFDTARSRLDEAASHLKAAGDPLSQGLLQCLQAEFHWMSGDAALADAALERASAIAVSVNVGARSELGLALGRVRSLAGWGAQPLELSR